MLSQTILPPEAADTANVYDMFVDTFFQHQLLRHLGSAERFETKLGSACKHSHEPRPQRDLTRRPREDARYHYGSP